MCYSDGARPPLPPVSGAAADHGDHTLRSADGTEFAAYFARAERPSGAGMLVLPDVRGLHHFYKELAQRFAEAGVDALAIDYFARTAPDSRRDEDFEWRSHVDRSAPETVDADARAGIDWLRSAPGGVRSVFTVGFCWGGSNSWRQSATQQGVAGCIGFYGVPARAREYIPRMRAPLLLLVAGDDHTPQEEFHRFDRELSEAGVEHEMHAYEGAPHSFFDRTFDQHRAACDDAWRRMLGFIERHTA
ncbi:MAG TPA: dienelactone hydrolase family protein [Candidatus Dormibacteraeota bacterium]